MMKKIFPYILIVLIVGQLLAPFTVGVGIKNNLEVKSNKAEAANKYFYVVTHPDGSTSFLPTGTFGAGTATIEECQKDMQDNAVTNTADGSIVSADCSNGKTTSQTVADSQPKLSEQDTSDLACTIIPFRPGACIAQGLYWLFFKTTSAVFGLAGKIMDFTLMYSIQDSSYRSGFVVEGWGLVRDFCNMFFIFVLLYIAFGTILKLNSVKTKEMIINVVIIGLLINFSLFATQVIIDASNILARVFYNPQTIVTGSQKDADGKTISELGDFGEIKLSEAIVSKVDPQDLIINSQKVNEIPVKEIAGGEAPETTGKGITVGSFILIIFLATAVNVVGTIAFLSCALIFIGRVVMLWLAMILAPLAFFSYTVPELGKLKMIGHQHWWPETLSMAFVAPIFAFFMYLIVGFMSKGLDIINADKLTGLSFVVAIVVPFIFIMVLLMKAKSVAVSMSGDVGAALSKAGATVGGLALGATVGAGAMAMRGTIGRVAANVSEKEGFKKWAAKSKFGGSMLQTTRGIASSSFDARATKLGSVAGKGLGVDIGKAKEGGFTKSRKDYVEKQEKFASSLEMSEKERYDRGLTFTGRETPEQRKDLEEQIKDINRDRTLTRAETVEKSGIPTASKKIAATKIREAGKNKEKKLQDAAVAFATSSGDGGGSKVTSSNGGAGEGNPHK